MVDQILHIVAFVAARGLFRILQPPPVPGRFGHGLRLRVVVALLAVHRLGGFRIADIVRRGCARIAGHRRRLLPASPTRGGVPAFTRPRRSEERRVGKESVSTCSYWWSPYHSKQTMTAITSNTQK